MDHTDKLKLARDIERLATDDPGLAQAVGKTASGEPLSEYLMPGWDLFLQEVATQVERQIDRSDADISVRASIKGTQMWLYLTVHDAGMAEEPATKAEVNLGFNLFLEPMHHFAHVTLADGSKTMVEIDMPARLGVARMKPDQLAYAVTATLADYLGTY